MYLAHQSQNLPASVPASRSPSPAGNEVLTLRALVSTKDAGVIIGKGGKNVADLREQTGVKAGVSKVIPGVHERVLTVSGSVEGVAKVCTLFSSTIHWIIHLLYSGVHYHCLATLSSSFIAGRD